MKAEAFDWPPSSSSSRAGAGRAAAHRAQLPSQQQQNARQRQELFGNAYAHNYSAQPGGTTAANDVADVSDWDSMTVEQLQAQTKRHQETMKESEVRMLRLAADATQTGAATLEQLHHQGEQLRHIRSEQTKIDSHLTTSDKILKGMESWGGALKNWFISKTEAAKANPPESSSMPTPVAGGVHRSKDGQPPGSSNPFSAGAGGNPQDTRPGGTRQLVGDEEEDDSMSKLGALVDGLHGMALSMKDEVLNQGHVLDGTIDSAERQQNKLQNVTARTKKVGNRGFFG